jgi:PAS domain S-box-containing protein
MTAGGSVDGLTMETLESLFQSSGDGACGVNPEQRIVLWNPAAEEMLGYRAYEVLGRHCYDVLRGVGEDGCPVCGRRCTVFARARHMKTVATNNLHVRTREGTMLWLSVSTVALPPLLRPEAILVHLFRDITRDKACRDAVDRLVDRVGPPFAAVRIDQPRRDDLPDGTTLLTSREYEVLRLLAAGMSTRDLAETLSISVSTARNHIHNIITKLKVHSRMEAVMVALRNGLL